MKNFKTDQSAVSWGMKTHQMNNYLLCSDFVFVHSLSPKCFAEWLPKKTNEDIFNIEKKIEAARKKWIFKVIFLIHEERRRRKYIYLTHTYYFI